MGPMGRTIKACKTLAGACLRVHKCKGEEGLELDRKWASGGTGIPNERGSVGGAVCLQQGACLCCSCLHICSDPPDSYFSLQDINNW